MEMKKINVACIALFAAASATVAFADEAPAPGPSSGSFAVGPAIETLIGASVFSFFTYYLY